MRVVALLVEGHEAEAAAAGEGGAGVGYGFGLEDGLSVIHSV